MDNIIEYIQKISYLLKIELLKLSNKNYFQLIPSFYKISNLSFIYISLGFIFLIIITIIKYIFPCFIKDKNDLNISKNMKKKKTKKKKINKNNNLNGIQNHNFIQIKENDTIIDILRNRANHSIYSKRILYTFLNDYGKEIVNISYHDMNQEAMKLAYHLVKIVNVKKGDKIILCYPPGLEFSTGFWGCMYAGAIAIPVYPPYPGTLTKDLPKFNRLVNDSGAKVILTNKTYDLATKMASFKTLFVSKETSWPKNIHWVVTDSLSIPENSTFKPVKLKENDIAFFQYSSGSTSEPKAVTISHKNIISQLKTWNTIVEQDIMVSWLPSYHDMGLVGFTIVPAVMGARCISMSPISFIKNPSLWLNTISKYRATHICAPNFGYALVERKFTSDLLHTIDLSTVKQAICAAEPIRKDTLIDFYDKFHSRGFKMESFNCGYGLAETTLVCTGQDPLKPTRPSIIYLNKEELEKNNKAVLVKTNKKDSKNVVTLVGCGRPAPTFKVIVVNWETRTPVVDGTVGELWVQGPSVSVGYYNKETLTKDTFQATIALTQQNSSNETISTTENSYLRTGDLGFIHNSEIFITGRLKDLIIIRGRNIIPQDIEQTVEKSEIDYIRPGCVAAFSIERENEERLVIVAELKLDIKKDVDLLTVTCQRIQQNVLSLHQLSCYSVCLLLPRTIPKTTSGKIQRNATKSAYLNNTLKQQYIFITKTEAVKNKDAKQKSITNKNSNDKNALQSEKTHKSKEAKITRSPKEIEEWLVNKLVSHRKSAENVDNDQDFDKLDENTPWSAFGMDSVAIVNLSAELGEYLDVFVPPPAFFEYETPHLIANAKGLATGDLALEHEQNSIATNSDENKGEIPQSSYMVEKFPEYIYLKGQISELNKVGLQVPYLDVLTEKKRKMVNYNTYNYLGLANDIRVSLASKNAIDIYGTSMSSSPIVGQTEINVELENKLCSFFKAESAILYVGGWCANVTTIDSLLQDKKDLVLCDSLNHNSCVTGQRLSGASILAFPHNDWKTAERILKGVRHKYRRVLIIIEGVYSMDGDLPDLPKFIDLKKRYKALLFLDEAHSFGTMGRTGKGMCEYYNLNPNDIDLRMGTMSKAMGSTGGFILGSKNMIDYLKYCAGGFVFSVGLTPCNAASALKSLKLMEEERTRVETLQELSCYFYDKIKKLDLDIGNSVRGAPVIVVIIGSSVATATVSNNLAKDNINVKPILYPAVEEGKCRLRFFMSSSKTKEDIDRTIAGLIKYT